MLSHGWPSLTAGYFIIFLLRRLAILSALAVLMVLAVLPVAANTRAFNGSETLITASRSPLILTSFAYSLSDNEVNASEKLTPRWQQRDYQIVHSSVCYNYKLQSIEYRRCRTLAKQQFKQRCMGFREKASSTQYPFNKNYIRKQQMYCSAARTFNPIRH